MANNITVDTYFQWDGTSWSYGPTNPPSPGSQDPIDIQPGVDLATLNFHLLSSTVGPDKQFEVGDPIWIQQNSCPTKHHVSQAMSPTIPCASNLLTVADQNKGNKGDFAYRLNFSDGTYLDPIIKNGGTGFNAFLALGVAVAAVAIAAVAFTQLS